MTHLMKKEPEFPASGSATTICLDDPSTEMTPYGLSLGNTVMVDSLKDEIRTPF